MKLKTCGAARLVQRARLTETDCTFANRFLGQRFSFHALSCKVSGVEVERGPSRFANTDVQHFVGRASLSSFNHCLGVLAFCFSALLQPSKSSRFTWRCKLTASAYRHETLCAKLLQCKLSSRHSKRSSGV